MKIVAVYNPKSGGSYHRVKLWSEFVENVTLVEDLTEDHVKDCDILYIHWNSKVPITTLSIWREKYGFKIIADVDDVWRLPEEFQYSAFLSQHLCQLADHVVCSTEYLVSDIVNWNLNVTVIPNLLPAGYGQFTPGRKIHKKIRVGIGGSVSHYKDYLSLKPIIESMEKNKWVRNNIEFAIIGYNALDKRWKKVAKMFKNVKLYGVKPHESYMSLYDNLDVMLLPLLDTEINRGRSLLKIHECYCKNVVPLISNVDFKKIQNVNPSSIELTLSLITSWHATQYLESRGKIIFEESFLIKKCFEQMNYMSINVDYKKDCVETRLELFQKVLDRPTVSNHDLYSITYSDKQDVEYQEFRNTINSVKDKSYLFEYNSIIHTLDIVATTGNYVGFFSHKFPHKTGFYRKYVEDVLDNEDSDVVIFCKQHPDYLAWTEEQHPGFMNIFEKVCSKLDLEIPSEVPTVYSNFFAAKANVYKDYVEVLKKAIDIMETDQEIKDLCWNDSGYETGLNPADLKKYTGLDYYPFHTFILERLMSVWIINKKLTYATYN